MNTITANCCNEMEKLLATRVTKVFITAAVLLPLLIKLFVAKIIVTNWMALPADSINFSILDLFNTIILPLFSFIASTYLFTGERERGTLFHVRPISRLELYLTKTIAICLHLGIQLFLVWLSILVSSAIIDQAFHLSMVLSSLGAIFVSWLPLIVLTALAILLGQIVNSSVIAIASMILLYIVMVFLPFVSPTLMHLFPTSYLDWYMQWLGNVSFPWIVQTVTYLCSSLSLFLISGYYIFNRKEA